MKIMRVIGNRIFCYSWWPEKEGVEPGGWFRILWVFGLAFHNIRQRGLLFSERHGYGCFIVCNGWLIRWIRPGWRP